MKFQQVRPQVVKNQREPFRAPDPTADVLVPLLQALVGAALPCGALVLIIVGIKEHEANVIILGVFLIMATIIWFARMLASQDALYRIEQLADVDLNADGVIGRPPRAMTTNRKRATMHPETERLREFVHFCYQQKPSHRALRRRFSESEILRYRDLLMRPDVGIAAWKDRRDRKAGWDMVVPVEQAMSTIDGIEWL